MKFRLNLKKCKYYKTENDHEILNFYAGSTKITNFRDNHQYFKEK